MRYGSFATVILLMTAIVAACGEDGVGFDASTEAPKVGGSMLGQRYSDSAGVRRRDPRDTFTIHVAQQLPAYAGRVIVVPFLQHGDDTSFVHYESSGDVALYDPPIALPLAGLTWMRIPAAWIIHPYGLKIDVEQALLDSTLHPSSGMGRVVRATAAQKFLGPEIVPTAQGPLYTVKSSSIRTITVDEGTIHREAVLHLTMWYSPKLGSFVQADSVKLYDDGSGRGLLEVGHTGWAIASYNLMR